MRISSCMWLGESEKVNKVNKVNKVKYTKYPEANARGIYILS